MLGAPISFSIACLMSASEFAIQGWAMGSFCRMGHLPLGAPAAASHHAYTAYSCIARLCFSIAAANVRQAMRIRVLRLGPISTRI